MSGHFFNYSFYVIIVCICSVFLDYTPILMEKNIKQKKVLPNKLPTV